MPQEKLFETQYKKLNTAQKKAVDSIEGPVMVVAGPGTGKTAILTLRIANILKKTDTEPDNILALTFTESATANMRRRLAEIIGSSAYRVSIHTFHGFCNDIIKTYPEEFGKIIGATNITEIDQIQILKDVISKLSIKELKPFGDVFYYLKPILGAINQLKREGISCEEFSNFAARELEDFEKIDDLYHEKGPHKGKMKGDYQTILKYIKKNQELVNVYQNYQERLTQAKLYDYSDMIMEVLRELRQNPELLLILQEKHQYVLVDEHQDTNNAQNKILELLCNFHPNPNIFIVGDEKQAIFRFQGASLENFNYFKKLYPKAVLINLTDNYRSTQDILDTAHSLLAGPTKLQSATKGKGGITVLSFSRPEVENYFLAQDIQQKIKTGVKADEIAVLYRDNRDVFSIAQALEKSGVPFVIESDQNILDDPDIKKLIVLMDAINCFGQDEKLFEAMHADFLRIEPLDLYKIIRYFNKEKISGFDILRSPIIMKGLQFESPDLLQEFNSKLTSWKRYSDNHSLPEFFEKLIRESGFLAYLLNSPEAVEKMDKLNAFFDEIQGLIETHREYRLRDFFDYLEILREQNVNIKRRLAGHTAERVHLMTAHKSKGQEFEYVYIVNAYDGHWGNKRKPNLIKLPTRVFSLMGAGGIGGDTDNNDERRLFYVAVTRAKKGVIITYSETGADKRDQVASQFVAELDEKLVSFGDARPYEKGFATAKEMRFAPSKKVHVNLKSKEFIKSVFTDRGLNVSALNNYLECPWKYFYTNLLRIPRPQEKHQMYGTAIHASLKDFFDSLNEDSSSKKFLLERFDYYISRQSMTDVEMADYQKRGIEALSGYYDIYHDSWKGKYLSEFSISGVILTPEIRLTGQIDKMELRGNSKEVNVVDYKTGKPKSRNLIDGKTKNADGNIKRQLVFYNLLLNKYEDGKKFKMTSGDIDFVEPDEKGRYHKESFVVDKKEVSELEKTIHQVTKEILNLEFWDKFCDDKDCEFCAIRKMMG